MLSPVALECDAIVAHQPSYVTNQVDPFVESVGIVLDQSAGLAAHARMPAGRVFVHLTDDAETKTEVEAEQNRRWAEARRVREKAAAQAAGLSVKAWQRARRAAR